MNAISTGPTIAQGLSTNGPLATMHRWWLAYRAWRIEQAAIAELCSMSDRELKDIGICRCEIPGVVIAGRAGSRVQPLQPRMQTTEREK